MTGTGDKEVHVVTGGAGFPGFSLGKQLTKKGHLVRLFDIKEPVWELEDGMEFIKGDIVEGRKLCEVIKGANAVYHLASYGMSGREQLNKDLIEKINLGGTEAVLKGKNFGLCRQIYKVTAERKYHQTSQSLKYLKSAK
uniref:3-beta hydroxysteroid dehydrogenase/isomerase domain-containing protein n=1 Tax=Biomphalaria glabrata TaxID=6526 RepID=A0A2C9K910_BIOGL